MKSNIKKIAKRFVLALTGFFGMMMFTSCYGMITDDSDTMEYQPAESSETEQAET